MKFMDIPCSKKCTEIGEGRRRVLHKKISKEDPKKHIKKSKKTQKIEIK
jgi:hypothetical protein